MAGAAAKHVAAVIEECLQGFAQAHHARRHALVEDVEIQGDARFQLGLAEQLLHQDLRLDRAALRHQHDADVLGGFVAHILERGELLLLDELRNAFDELGLLHLIGNLVDDDLIGAARAFFALPACAHAEAAAPGSIGLLDGGGIIDDDAAGREVGTLDELEDGAVLHLWVLHQRDQRLTELAGIVRRNRCRHADGDAGSTVRQQIGKSARKNDRLAVFAVIGGAEIDGVFFDALKKRVGNLGEPAFGIAHRGGIIAVDIAEIALPFDQRITNGEVLRQTHERVIDRLIAMGMEFADDIADDAGAFLEARRRIKAQLAHCVQQAAVNGLQPIARIGKRARGDGGKRIGEVALG